MAKTRWILFLLLTAVSLLAGCGGGSTANVQNPPPPSVTKVSIAFQPSPAGSLQLGQTTNLTAVVSNDPSNAGVDWTVTCQGTSNCGSLSSQHTSSDQATTYTSPSTLAGNSQTVNIVAFATADHTRNVVAPIAVTGFGGSLVGSFVLQAQGVNPFSLVPYQFAGVIVLDGNGGIKSVEQTVNFVNPNTGVLMSQPDSNSVNAGSYFIGPDGRGTITINTNDAALGVSGVETFSFVFLSSSQALITQTDGTASANGTMDLQTSMSPPSAGYAFVVSGTDLSTFLPTAFGGVFNIDSPNNISGRGSIGDQNLAGTLTRNSTLSGTVSNPDLFGAVTINLTIGFAPGPVQFTGYIVDATHIKLIESDNSSGAGVGSTAGVAIGQGAATGTFKTAASLSGTFVFGVPGVDLTPNSSSMTPPSTFTSAGQFSADGAGHLKNGFTDTFLQANCAQASCTQNGIFGAQISAAFGGTYTVAATGSGRVQAAFTGFSPHPTPGFQPVFFLYLTGNGNPALVLDAGDATINPQTGLPNYPSVGAGIAYPQSAAPPTFGGKYGLSIAQENGSTENDGIGPITADPAANTVSGVMDTGSGVLDSPINGSFASLGANGRFTGTLTGQGFEFLSPLTSSFAVEYYAIDAGHGFFVESDLLDPNNPSAVVSFGYYAARTPVCAGCP